MSQTPLTRDELARGFLAAGIRPGGVLLVHSSLSSFGSVDGGASTVIDALLDALGPEGTLCVPTLSYLFVDADRPTFDVRSTPTNLGAIPETFRTRAGVTRSLHPTHSVAACGPAAGEVTGSHWRDTTPVGPHSPFTRVRDLRGQVAFLGCGARSNTSIHGVEEALPAGPPPYLLQPGTVEYSLVDCDGVTRVASHRRHDFTATGQRYERLVPGMPAGTYSEARVGGALVQARAACALRGLQKPTSPLTPIRVHPPTQVFDARAMWEHATALLSADPLALVEHVPAGEGHFLVRAGGGSGESGPPPIWRYRVGPTAAPAAAP